MNYTDKVAILKPTIEERLKSAKTQIQVILKDPREFKLTEENKEQESRIPLPRKFEI